MQIRLPKAVAPALLLYGDMNLQSDGSWNNENLFSASLNAFGAGHGIMNRLSTPARPDPPHAAHPYRASGPAYANEITAASRPARAVIAPTAIGIVIMHGKGGSPTMHVSELASALEGKGYLVANLEMPWSGRRHYDVNVDAAEQEVESALDALRGMGAAKLFVAGHSLGGLFALYFGGKHAVDGVIAIAPGGSVGRAVFRENLSASVEKARMLIAEGKGEDKALFKDYEASRGMYRVIAKPAAYLSWFDPEGAINQMAAIKNIRPATPVLFIVPTRDYPGLLKVKEEMFSALPKNPLTKLSEPNAGHRDAPAASINTIVEWTAAVADRR
jgi:pimeloyl-ACP methyl ester carboxylesterase